MQTQNAGTPHTTHRSDETEGVKSLGINDAGAGAANMARVTSETFLPYRLFGKEGLNNEEGNFHGSQADRVGLYQWKNSLPC